MRKEGRQAPFSQAVSPSSLKEVAIETFYREIPSTTRALETRLEALANRTRLPHGAASVLNLAAVTVQVPIELEISRSSREKKAGKGQREIVLFRRKNGLRGNVAVRERTA